MWEFYPHAHGRGICKDDPYVKKMDIPLLRNTLVSKIDQKNDPLSMDPEYRATPSTIPMSSIQRIRRLVDSRNDDHFIAH